MREISSLEAWVDAVRELPCAALSTRVVVVPNERVAHSLRKQLVGHAALAGTRFVSAAQLAASPDRAAPAANASELGPYLVREALKTVDLERLEPGELLAVPGWCELIARTMSELASACVEPHVLRASDDPVVRDMGAIYATLREGGEWIPPARVFEVAASGLREPCLVVTSGDESEAELRFLRALPDVRWARWSRASPAAASSSLGNLQQQFMQPEPRAVPADDSLHLLIHAGVHEEVEAAVAWVGEQIGRGVPLDEIALLSPAIDAYGPLLRARLTTLPIVPPTYSERGVPVCERSDGQRVLALLRGLQSGLAREELAALLPTLRTHDPEQRVRGPSRAWELLNTVAFAGGDPNHRQAGLQWAPRWHAALDRLERSSHAGGGLEEKEAAIRTARHATLLALQPGIEALVRALGLLVGDRPLRELAQDVEQLCGQLKLPPAVPPAPSVLASAIRAFEGHERHEPRGIEALDWLEQTLRESVVKEGRFGEPRLYLGSPRGSRGLSFRCVRMLGLVEGSIPSAVREDAVLPDSARSVLSLVTSRERARRQVLAFHDALNSAREQLVLSAPRVSLERSVRQPATVLLDVVRTIEGVASLERRLDDAARAGRASEREQRERTPLTASARLARIAKETVAPKNVALMRAIRDRSQPGVQDGLLPGMVPREQLAGFTAERPISASRLATLLACPHRYLYENVLGFREPESALPTDLLPVTTFGTWLHAIAERFWREHGPNLTLSDAAVHRAALRALAETCFEELRTEHPFANPESERAQLDALCDQLDKLLQHDLGDPKHFVDVERGFGYDAPCVLPTEAGPLYVRGKIDKLDRVGDTLLVRDIKTGGGKPRRADEGPQLGIDLQLGVYAQVAKRLAKPWSTPSDVAVAYLYLRKGDVERGWRDADYTALEQATNQWLATAVDTLAAGAFVRTLDQEQDCAFCAFGPVCESELTHSEAALHAAPRRLRVLKERT